MKPQAITREAPVLLLIGLGIVAASVYVARSQVSTLVLATLVAAIAAYFALMRFEVVTLVMIAARTSIELIPVSPGAEILRVSVVATAAYTLAAVVWLVRSTRELRIRPSSLAWAVAGLAGAAGLSAVLSAEPLQAALGAARWFFLAVFVLVLERLIAADAEAPIRQATSLGVSRGSTEETRTPHSSYVRLVLMAMLVSAVVPLAIGAWQIVTSPASFISGEGRVSGSLSHPNTFGFYLVVVILGLLAVLPYLKRSTRPWLLALAGLAVVELAATYSRTSYVALAAGLAVLILVGRRWVLLSVAVMVLVLATLIPGISQRWGDLDQAVTLRGTPANTLAWRLDYWKVVLEASEERRVTGLGFGVIGDTTDQQRQPHNDFVRALAELGMIGLLAYAGLLAALIWRAVAAVVATRGRQYRKKLTRGLAEGCAGITAAFLVGSVTGNLMTQLVILWYVLGFAVLAGTAVTRRQPVSSDVYEHA